MKRKPVQLTPEQMKAWNALANEGTKKALHESIAKQQEKIKYLQQRNAFWMEKSSMYQEKFNATRQADLERCHKNVRYLKHRLLQ